VSANDAGLSVDALFYAGIASDGCADPAGAERYFSRYLEKDPTGALAPAALYMKGVSMFQQGRGKEADQLFSAVIQQYPGDPVAPLAREALERK
jgi:TolA-binding protein